MRTRTQGETLTPSSPKKQNTPPPPLSSLGFLTGALFRSPRGPRTAAVAGVLGAAAAGALAAARAHINPNL